MALNWQDIVALSIVCIAVVDVAILVYRGLRRRATDACGGGCYGCTQHAPEAKKLITTIGVSESVDKRVPRAS